MRGAYRRNILVPDPRTKPTPSTEFLSLRSHNPKRSMGDRTNDGNVQFRMMVPFTVQCTKCSTFLYRGEEFSAKREPVGGPDGHSRQSITRWRFVIECSQCSRPLTFLTDPEHADYEMESGGARVYEIRQDQAKTKARRQEKEVKQQRPKPDAGVDGCGEGFMVFVYQLDSKTTEETLRAKFSQFGEVTDVFRYIEPHAIVIFANLLDAEVAIRKMRPSRVDGSSIIVVRYGKQWTGRRGCGGVRLVVRNLDNDTCEERLRTQFSHFGEVIEVFRSPDSFGIVTFSKRSDAESAIRKMDQSLVDGSTIRVDHCLPGMERWMCFLENDGVSGCFQLSKCSLIVHWTEIDRLANS